jgi:hypothetical protein
MVFVIRQASAQTLMPQVFVSSGDIYDTPSGYLSWTLGEPFGETYSAGSVILTPGFQQADLLITNIEEHPSQLSINPYPNPTSNILQLDVKGDHNRMLEVRLLDVNGRTVIEKTIDASVEKTEMDLSGCSGGMYYLQVSSNSGTKDLIYKIQKIK